MEPTVKTTQTMSVSLFPTHAPTDVVASNSNDGGISTTDTIIISVVLVVFGCAAIVGIIMYFCRSNRNRGTHSPFSGIPMADL